MRYRRLGSTGPDVSVVSLGSWLTFGAAVDEERSIACIRRAFDLGVNLFDTANVYGAGWAEEVVGRALGSLPRDCVFVATKVFFPMGRDRAIVGSGAPTSCTSATRACSGWASTRSTCTSATGTTPRLRSRRRAA